MCEPERLDFRASSYSNGGTGCVEPAPHSCGVTVRDSKDPRGPRLEFTHEQWMQFVQEVLDAVPCTNGAVTISTEKQVLVYNGAPTLTCWHLHAVDSGVALHFTAEERWAFECGAREREFVFPHGAEALEPSAA